MANIPQRWTAHIYQHFWHLGYRSTWDKVSFTIVEGSFTQVKIRKTMGIWGNQETMSTVDWINNTDITKYIPLGEKWIGIILLTTVHVLDENFSKERKYTIEISLINTLMPPLEKHNSLNLQRRILHIYIYLNLIIRGIFLY